MQMRQTEYEVMELLEWDLMLYSMFKYECALKYLEVCMGGDVAAIRQLEECVAFWGWWRLHWYLREQEWLREVAFGNYAPTKMFVQGDGVLRLMQRTVAIMKSPMQGIHGRRAIYQVLNNPVDLALGKSRSGQVLEDSYCKDLVKELR